MGPLAIFGITNDGLNLAVNLLLLFLVVIWLALVYWTYADARRRIEDPMLVACATAASLFPFLGTIVYLIVRPPEYLDDVRERELEIAAAEARLASLEHLHCPYCDFEIEKTFLRCPSCLRRLKEPCTLRQAARPALEDLPVLRGRGRRQPRRGRRGAAASAAPATSAGAAPPRAARSRAPPTSARSPERSSPRPAEPAVGRLSARTRPTVRTPRTDRRRTAMDQDPDPGQARRVRARPHRRDPRPLRAQGPARSSRSST